VKKSNKITISRALSMNVVTDMIGAYTNIGEGAEELRTLLRLKGIDYIPSMEPISAEYFEHGDGGLSYGRTDEWLAIEEEFKPKVIDICKKLAPHADREVVTKGDTHLERLVEYNCDGDFFDTLWDYGYGGVDKAIMYFPLAYDIQLTVLNELVDWIEEKENNDR
jgi:hypothetical protein